MEAVWIVNKNHVAPGQSPVVETCVFSEEKLAKEYFDEAHRSIREIGEEDDWAVVSGGEDGDYRWYEYSYLGSLKDVLEMNKVYVNDKASRFGGFLSQWKTLTGSGERGTE